MSNHRLVLIDANSFCYRAFYAIRGLATSYGQPTNAVYGFVNMLKKILKDYQPDYLGICFDVGKETFRQKKFSEYKIHREPMPDDLVSQMPIIKEVISAFNLSTLEMEGYEADDVIATVAQKLAGKDLEVIIVSGDKDILQLVDKRIKVFSPAKEGILFDADKVSEVFGVGPDRLGDLLALMGDKTDNIPGITGIGEVTAKSLLREFGSLERILKSADKIGSDKLRQMIKSQHAQAILSRELATLDKNVPLEFDLDSLKVGSPRQQELFEIFRKLEFKKLLRELSPQADGAKQPEIKIIEKPEELDDLARRINAAKGEAAFLADFSVESWPQARLNHLYFCLREKEAGVFPAGQVNRVRKFMADDKPAKITYDFKSAIIALKDSQIEIKGKVFDVLLAAYLLDPAKTSFAIEELCWEYLDGAQVAGMETAAKSEAVFRLKPILEQRLKEKKLLDLFFKVEIPLAEVLAEMELTGVKIDTAILKELSEKIQVRVGKLTEEIYGLAQEEFNLNSPKQLSHILFEKMKLPMVKKTKTGASTDEEVLRRLAGKHKIAEMLLEYRQLAKLASTYIDALPKLINPQTGRLHTSFNQTGTETGRLSSSGPNLQNIPVKTQLGRQIRKAFVAGGANFFLLSADYSQIELRILAHLSQDENLLRAFRKDEDIHTFTASLIFNQKLNEVTDQMRNTAKRVNFGIIYGMSAYGLAKDLHISQEMAQDFIDAYFLRYPGVRVFCEGQINQARKTGFVTTILGRRRYLPQINSSNNTLRQFAERQAINAPVQGSAADLIKLAMINIQKELKEKGLKSRLTLQVHDELVFDCPDAEKEQMPVLVREAMENVLKLSVPVKAGIGIGKNWLDLKSAK